jgi:TolB-like protein/Tfp pilus assembly protein PilF
MIPAQAKPDTKDIEDQLARILRSRTFAPSLRSQKFLQYVVGKSLSDDPPPKEFAIAVDVFDRDTSYDPSVDATVRVQAGRLRSRLREYYDDEGKDDPIVINIPTGSYAPAFSVREQSADAPGKLLTAMPETPPGQTSEAPPADGPSSRFLSLLWILIPLAALCLIILTVVVVRHRTRPDSPIHSLAVLPLANLSQDPAMEYFADGMTDELITEVAETPGIRVVSRTSAMQQKGSRESLHEIARKLDVDAIVEGSVIRSNGRIRLNVRLVDTRSDKNLWAQSFEESTSDVLALQERLAHEIAAHARVLLVLPPRREGSKETVNPEAYDYYLRGLYFLHRREPAKSAGYFERAIAIDQNYARAHAGLAEAIDSERTLNVMPSSEAVPKIIASAKRAIELDPDTGEAWSVLAIVANDCQWDWNAAEQYFKRALALSPNYSIGEMRYALYLNVQGRQDEAEAHMRRALQLDPLSFWVTRQLGTQLYFSRKYDESIEYLSRAEEMEPTQIYQIYNWKSRAYEKRGLLDQAVATDIVEFTTRFPEVPGEKLRSAYKDRGWRGYWTKRLQLTKPYASRDCVPYDLALGYARLGDRDQTFFWLDRMFTDRCYLISDAKVDPLLDPIRDDPRYEVLLRRLNLAR